MPYPIDENTPNAATNRPAESAMGSTRKYFQDRNPAGGITGTTLQAADLNWLFGNMIQVCLDSGITMASGASGDSNLGDALRALAASMRRGQLEAELIWTSGSVVTLATVRGTKLAVEIDGEIVENTGSLAFNAATHWDGTAEAASTPIYLYVHNASGVLTPHMTHTAPYLPAGTKPGYHTTNTTWRCVGTCFNDGTSNIVPFRQSNGWHLFRERVSDHTHSPGTGTTTAWTSITLALPKGVTSVKILVQAQVDQAAVVYGPTGGASTLPSAQAAVALDTAGLESISALFVEQGISASPFDHVVQTEIAISDPNAPAVRWGAFGAGSGGTPALSVHKMRVLGYRCGFGPQV